MRILWILALIYVGFLVLVYFRQRSMLFFPTHGVAATRLSPWPDCQRTLCFCREVANPQTIWLMMHGNAGQAADRDYVLRRMSDQDSLYVLEYPGYGGREGRPSLESFNQAASEAYRQLRSRNPTTPVCILGESIGCGPACALALEKLPPEKIVLVVPFDSLTKVAAGHFPFLPVRLLLRDGWDNVEALKDYSGPVEIFGAESDNIIPIRHARALARQIPQAQFTVIPGGHNDWSEHDEVRIRR